MQEVTDLLLSIRWRRNQLWDVCIVASVVCKPSSFYWLQSRMAATSYGRVRPLLEHILCVCCKCVRYVIPDILTLDCGCIVLSLWVFTARRYASVIHAMALCPSVSVSVASQCSTKMTKRRITQTKTHDSPVTLVFWCQRSLRHSTGVTPSGDAKCRWGGLKSATFDK